MMTRRENEFIKRREEIKRLKKVAVNIDVLKPKELIVKEHWGIFTG